MKGEKVLNEEQERKIRDEISDLEDMPELIGKGKAQDLAATIIQESDYGTVRWLIVFYRNVRGIVRGKK